MADAAVSPDVEMCCRTLLKSFGATVVGVKPAELKSIRSCWEDYRGWKQCKKQLLALKELRVLKINQTDNRTKVFVYHAPALDDWLNNNQVLKFLREYGYPVQYSLQVYIDFLAARLRNYEQEASDFPHELGIFLGYPLKDVLGFVGELNLELSCRRQWKIYGKKSISVAREQEFAAAKAELARRLDQLADINDLHKIL